MLPATQRAATLDDLYKVEGKAELIDGRIVQFMGSGYEPSSVALEITVSLRLHAKASGEGKAFADGVGYALAPPLTNRRQSFRPDASYYVGPPPANRMRFIEGTPTLAVEVRSENDHGPSAEAEMEAKRVDDFEAGTIVVWDVDPVARTVAVHRGDPSTPAAVYGPGQSAEAEPAVPGWTLAVDDLFA